MTQEQLEKKAKEHLNETVAVNPNRTPIELADFVNQEKIRAFIKGYNLSQEEIETKSCENCKHININPNDGYCNENRFLGQCSNIDQEMLYVYKDDICKYWKEKEK